MKTYRTVSSEETRKLGERFVQELHAASRGSAAVVVLSGELGAGKTTFVQGFFRGMGIKRNPQSPTFVIVRRYRVPPGKHAPFTHLIHMDAYRLKGADQLAPLGFDALLSDPGNLLLIEWGERIKDALPKRSVRHLVFHHGRTENERKILIK